MASLLWYLEREADGRVNASACSVLILYQTSIESSIELVSMLCFQSLKEAYSLVCEPNTYLRA